MYRNAAALALALAAMGPGTGPVAEWPIRMRPGYGDVRITSAPRRHYSPNAKRRAKNRARNRIARLSRRRNRA